VGEVGVERRIANPIYATNTYCTTCKAKRPLGTKFCPECRRRVRTHSYHRKKGDSELRDVR